MCVVSGLMRIWVISFMIFIGCFVGSGKLVNLKEWIMVFWWRFV